MIRFLIKGLLRDRHRSLLPMIVVSGGVAITVMMHAWVTGIISDGIEASADYSTGHVKVMTRAYRENSDQIPNDLAILGVDTVLQQLRTEFPSIEWVVRINFGGIVDVPDSLGETRAQGPAMGMAIDLLSAGSREAGRFNLAKSIAQGQLPRRTGEILLSDDYARKLGVKPGDKVTLMTSTMYGSVSLENFTVAGTVRFGITAIDRGAVIVDISDAQRMLDMQNAAGEILGYFASGSFDDDRASQVAAEYNARYAGSDDRFSPVMVKLTEQGDLAVMMASIGGVVFILVGVFVGVMSIVLWNAGLIGGLRRYGEVGVRLALGEDKGEVYRSMLVESTLIGLAGSVLGTLLGLAVAYFLQEVGFDSSSMMKNMTIMMPTVFRAKITTATFYIGFIPGFLSTILGTALSGFGIYRRSTSRLFKELEA